MRGQKRNTKKECAGILIGQSFRNWFCVGGNAIHTCQVPVLNKCAGMPIAIEQVYQYAHPFMVNECAGMLIAIEHMYWYAHS